LVGDCRVGRRPPTMFGQRAGLLHRKPLAVVGRRAAAGRAGARDGKRAFGCYCSDGLSQPRRESEHGRARRAAAIFMRRAWHDDHFTTSRFTHDQGESDGTSAIAFFSRRELHDKGKVRQWAGSGPVEVYNEGRRDIRSWPATRLAADENSSMCDGDDLVPVRRPEQISEEGTYAGRRSSWGTLVPTVDRVEKYYRRRKNLVRRA